MATQTSGGCTLAIWTRSNLAGRVGELYPALSTGFDPFQLVTKMVTAMSSMNCFNGDGMLLMPFC